MILATILSFLAAADSTAEALESLNALWLVVGGFVPLVYPFAVRAGAAKWFKLALSVTISVVVSLLTLIPQGGFDGMDASSIVIWVTSFLGVVQVVYKAADLLVETATSDPGGLNDLEFYRPEQGLKGP